VTERDTLVMVLLEFGEPEVYRRIAAQLDRGEITLQEEIRRQFEVVTAPLEVVRDWLLERVRVRPGFRELAERWRPIVISSGFHELIEPLLAREGVNVEVRSNWVDARPDGWRARFRDETVCEACGEACKRALLPPGEIVYVGDGYSDRCAALAAGRVFARGGLARYLAARQAPFEPFETFFDVMSALDGRPESRP
jgi:2-hydroxy-3-keto-5-methylthiopentenyl-1-phosphate phosphatase